MKTGILKVVKIILPVSLGILLIWWIYNQQTPEQQDKLIFAIKNANYWWIGLSLTAALLSHLSRAYRWLFMLESFGHRPKLINSFCAVMIGYGVNLLLPRVGEASRCGVIYKYEKIPFSKSFGTVLAERGVDFILLMSITAITFFTQFDIIDGVLAKSGVYERLEGLSIGWWLLIACIGLGGVYFAYYILTKSKFGDKVRAFVKGLGEGVKSVLKTKKKWAFLFHTAVIWGLYLFMFFICFQALPATSEISIGGMLTGFVLGSFAVVLLPGGIGAYQGAIAISLLEFGVSEGEGFALGNIIWASQTLLLIVAAIICGILIQAMNKTTYEPETK